jgi:hypothetical protein
MKINRLLQERLDAKREGVYKTPFKIRPIWGGKAWKTGAYHARYAETPDDWSDMAGRADEILSLRHSGWYCDSLQDGIRFGLVRKVRTMRGVKYLACMNDPWNGDKDGNGPCAVEVHPDGMPVWYDDEKEAARNADGMAEQTAEKEREYDEQWQKRARAEEEAGEARKEIAGLRTKARSLVAGIRQSTLAPSLCLYLREELQRIRQESAEAWETLRESMKTMERLKEFA